MSGSQVALGKAFEYVCLTTIEQQSQSLGIVVDVNKDKNFTTGQANFQGLPKDAQNNLTKGASAAINFIFDCEPYLKDGVLATRLELSMASDSEGQKGDVRDILMLRWSSKKKKWQCGISCKHNHDAIKHQRVGITKKSDFIANWTGEQFSCSPDFAKAIAGLENTIESNLKAKWSDVFSDMFADVYAPVIKAVVNELDRLKSDRNFVESLFEFLLGTKDFYKVMAFDDEKLTKVTVFNFNGTLNQKTTNLIPTKKVRKTVKPCQILGIWNDSHNISMMVGRLR